MLEIEFDDSEFRKEIDRLEKRAKKVGGEHRVSFGDLFTSSFMRRFTEYGSFEALLEAGEYDVNSQEDFEAIPDEEWDEHVARYTQFSNWQEMLEAASAEWTKKQMGWQ